MILSTFIAQSLSLRCGQISCSTTQTALNTKSRNCSSLMLSKRVPPKVAQGWFGTIDFQKTCGCAGLLPERVMHAYETRLALTKEGRWDEALDGIVQKGRHIK